MMNIHDALHEALIDYDEVEFMDDIELEGFLQDRLNDAEQEVLEKLGLYLEPNGSGSMGTFIIYDNDSNELAEIDFQEYNDKELELATECDNINQYKERYRAWVEGFKAVEEALTEEVSESPLRQYSRDPHGFDGWERDLKQWVNEGKLSWEEACMICLAAVDNLRYVDEIFYKLGFYNN